MGAVGSKMQIKYKSKKNQEKLHKHKVGILSNYFLCNLLIFMVFIENT